MKFTPPKRFRLLSDSMIREMTIEANKYGAINMGQGFPEFDPPRKPLESAQKTIGNKLCNQYSEDRGLPALREAVAGKYKCFYNLKIDPENEVTIVCGVTEAVVSSFLAVVEAGSKVVIIEPAHENYFAAALFCGASPVWVSLSSPEFKLDLNQVEDAFKAGAKFIILNSPHNPTGRVFSSNELEGLAKLCVTYDVIAITDEIYEHIVYDDNIHIPLVKFSGMRERTITTSGIGKAYSLTGWRVGFAIAPPEITRAIRRIHTYVSICAPTPFQYAAIEALNLPQSYYSDLMKLYHSSRRRMMEILRKTGFKAEEPQGAYYVMADFSSLSSEDDVSFCKRLVKEVLVALIPGSSFYYTSDKGKNLVRFAFPKPVAVLDRVAQRLSKALT